MEAINKNAEAELAAGVPDEEALSLISQYTKSKPEKENIYVFKVKLCDNEVDRDFEAFSANALKALETLMRGKTGIFDHNPKADNQVARIYDCKLITEDRKTKSGENYTYLAGFAYMPRTAATEDFISSIEAGIHKETSIGCCAKSRICSVCGKDSRICGHRKGEIYDGKLCYTVLDGITDAYEWSFVAVPAQIEAGVIKQFESDDTLIKSILDRSVNDTVIITKAEAVHLSEEISRLKKEAEIYKSELQAEVVRLSCISNTSLSFKAMKLIAEKMDCGELRELKLSLEKACRKTASPQIYSKHPTDNSGYEYKI